MNFQKSTANNLLHQLIYITLELPTKIILNTMFKITSSIRKYTQLKPMLRAVDYVLFYTSYRLQVLSDLTDDFSTNTGKFLNNIITFNSRLALCITSLLIKTGKACRAEITNSKSILPVTFLFPVKIVKNIYKNFNADFNEYPILTTGDINAIAKDINGYVKFCLSIAVAFILIPVPLVRSEKVALITDKIRSLPEHKVNIALRSSFALMFFSALFYCIYFKSDLIDHSMTAATHFITVTMLSVALTSLIVGPSKGLTKFMLINFVWSSLFCWQCSPIIIALS